MRVLEVIGDVTGLGYHLANLVIFVVVLLDQRFLRQLVLAELFTKVLIFTREFLLLLLRIAVSVLPMTRILLKSS